MSVRDTRNESSGLDFEYELEAPPAKVWRAVTVPALVERWLLPVDARTSRTATPPREVRLLEAETEKYVRYRLREADAGLIESEVTFELTPSASGGTLFRIRHEVARAPEAANTNLPAGAPMMSLAA